MKLQIRTKDNLAEVLKEGISYAWRMNKERLDSIVEVEIYDFSGKTRISGTFDRENTQILENGRVAVAFKDAKIEQTDFKWVGQNPIKYKALKEEEVKFIEDDGQEQKSNDEWEVTKELEEEFYFCNAHSDGTCGQNILLKTTSFKPVENYKIVIAYINKLFYDEDVDALFWYEDYDDKVVLWANTFVLDIGGVFEEHLSEYSTQEFKSIINSTGIHQAVKSVLLRLAGESQIPVASLIEQLFMAPGQKAQVELTDMIYGNSSFEINT